MEPAGLGVIPPYQDSGARSDDRAAIFSNPNSRHLKFDADADVWTQIVIAIPSSLSAVQQPEILEPQSAD